MGPELVTRYGVLWFERKYVAGAFIDVDELVSIVDGILRNGASMSIPSVTVYPRALGNRLAGILHGCLRTTYNETTTAWAHHNDQPTQLAS